MATEKIVSVVLEQLTAPVFEEIRKGVGLIAGASEAVEIIASNLRSIQAVLMDAEEKQVNNNAVRVWLDKLKEASYDVDDVLDERNTKNIKLQTDKGVANASLTLTKKVRLFFLSPGYSFRRTIFRCQIAFKIKEINDRLEVIAREKDMYNLNVVNSESIHKHHERATSSFVDVSDICGRDEQKDTLVSKLLSESHQEGKDLHIISVVGMGGIGKTTLAQFVYNDHRVVGNFKKRIWVCVSDLFDQFRIAKAILEALEGKASKLGELQALLERIATSIEGNNFFLVLDDVWEEDYKKWESLCNCLKNGLQSKILVTTRNEKVARKMKSIDIITVKELSEDKCWSLFERLAFVDRHIEEREKLEEVGRKIVGKCKGLPLAIKTIGSLLRFKKTSEEWERILKSEIWNLEEFKKDLFPALLLSYNDLPCMIKRCFSYCAIFPKDYNMEKDQLVQLWMAQGYLVLDHNEEMEEIGGEYFDDLAARSFFQDFEKDEYGNIIRCKMHDIVHDFAQSLTKDECFTLEVYGSNEPIGARTSSYSKARHSTVTLYVKDASFPISVLNAKRLRSLLINLYSEKCSNFSKLCDELKCLRALGFGVFWGVERISKKIGNLIHLRYLNFNSWDTLRELPETLCELYNLQTLDITGCYRLKKLPQGMGKLINLRHLLNGGTYSLEYMPKGIDRLTCLRTLKEFVVGGGSKGSGLECLKNLGSLRGSSLYIRNLGNVMNVDEVKKAQLLEENKYLIELRLCFGDERMNVIGDEQVLESLKPPSHLEKLHIHSYRGSSSTLLPISNMMLLTKLRYLTISDCNNFDRLPPLGKLSSLESLTIIKMNNVKRVSNEFLGISEDNNIGISSSSSSFIAFPKLKYLLVGWMEEWEEWDYKITRTAEEEEKEDIFMPSLLSLKIVSCNKLKELPHHLFKITMLKELIILDCSIIKKRCRREEIGDYWPMIAHIPTIQINSYYAKRDGVQIKED